MDHDLGHRVEDPDDETNGLIGAAEIVPDVRAEDGEIRVVLAVREQECTAAGNWVLAADKRGPWIGQAVGAERFQRGQAVTMVFSMERAFWFDSATGRTLIAPT